MRNLPQGTVRYLPFLGVTGNMAASDDWVTVSEAARRLGVTRAAVYNRIRRGTLQTVTDNHGKHLVMVTVTDTETVSVDTLRKVPSETYRKVSTETVTEPHQPAGGEAESISLAMHRETLERMERAHSASVALLVERVDAAECRAEAVESKLDRVLDTLLRQNDSGPSRPPWWWPFGSSRRSDIRGN